LPKDWGGYCDVFAVLKLSRQTFVCKPLPSHLHVYIRIRRVINGESGTRTTRWSLEVRMECLDLPVLCNWISAISDPCTTTTSYVILVSDINPVLFLILFWFCYRFDRVFVASTTRPDHLQKSINRTKSSITVKRNLINNFWKYYKERINKSLDKHLCSGNFC